ncbi:hypothetical protein LTR53_015390 [Teratosphaeriaceae sp. CCFEE 6253]|nr:hypothetical protein LTR53_015390 [Teratosphaeriaceae sp. CCFEE 6253]
MSCLTIVLCVPNPKHTKNTTAKWRLSTFWDTSAFNNPCFNWLTAAVFFIFLGFYPVFFNLEEWAAYMELGYREDIRPDHFPSNSVQTFELLSIMNASSFLGRLVSATISDYLGTKGALHVHGFVTSISSILLLAFWPFADTVPKARAFVFLFGMFSGAVIGLPAASMAFVIGKRNKLAQSKLGQWVGMMYTVAALSAMVGPLIAGHLITEFTSFLTVQLWTGASLFIAAACMVVCMYYERRQRQRRMSGATIDQVKSIESAGGIALPTRHNTG